MSEKPSETGFDFFFVKCDRKLEKINIADILYVEAMSNYVIIHTRNRHYTVYLTFKGIEEQLPADQFVRIHKSYIVSLAAIQNIEEDTACVREVRLPISKYYKPDVMERINGMLFKR